MGIDFVYVDIFAGNAAFADDGEEIVFAGFAFLDDVDIEDETHGFIGPYLEGFHDLEFFTGDFDRDWVPIDDAFDVLGV